MLCVTRSAGCTHNLTMRQNIIIIIKQHRTPNNYPGCKKLSCAVFQQKDGKQFFLKLVHKSTSWLLVSPKEDWEKKIPTTEKKQTNKQKIHIIFPLLLPADWGFLSRCFIFLWLRVHLLLIYPFQRKNPNNMQNLKDSSCVPCVQQVHSRLTIFQHLDGLEWKKR